MKSKQLLKDIHKNIKENQKLTLILLDIQSTCLELF